MYTTGPDGHPRVTGLRVGPQSGEHMVVADVYVAALDVPGAKNLLPKVGWAGRGVRLGEVWGEEGVWGWGV